MPPRKRASSAPKARTTASKAAARLNLSAEEEREIQEAWELCLDEEATDNAGEPAILCTDVRRVFAAMGIESSREELQEILSVLDPEDEGFVLYDRFLEVVAYKLQDRDTNEELEKAYRLFTNGGEGTIQLRDLRRIAEELQEDATDEQLRDMLDEACSKDAGWGVDLRDFEAVMRRAGVL